MNDASDVRPPEDIGRSVGPFGLVRRLGTGGMGEVYLAARTALSVWPRVMISYDAAPSNTGFLVNECTL